MRVRPAPATHFAEMRDATGVVLDLGNRNYLHLNASGALLWQVLEGGTTLAALSTVLQEHYGISANAADADARAWIDDMVGRGAVVIDD